jgi:hypothetical protein
VKRLFFYYALVSWLLLSGHTSGFYIFEAAGHFHRIKNVLVVDHTVYELLQLQEVFFFVYRL